MSEELKCDACDSDASVFWCQEHESERRAEVARLQRENDSLRLAVGDYHVQRGAPSWKPQCQIDLEVAREEVERLSMRRRQSRQWPTESSRTAVGTLIAYAEDRLRREACGVADQILDDLDRLDEARAEVERLEALEKGIRELCDRYDQIPWTGIPTAEARALLDGGGK